MGRRSTERFFVVAFVLFAANACIRAVSRRINLEVPGKGFRLLSMTSQSPSERQIDAVFGSVGVFFGGSQSKDGNGSPWQGFSFVVGGGDVSVKRVHGASVDADGLRVEEVGKAVCVDGGKA